VSQGQGLSPFLDVNSFSNASTSVDDARILPAARSPFLAVYELDETGGYSDPSGQEQRTFPAEMHDEELDEAIYEAIAEASELCDRAGAAGDRRESERLLNQHFQPLQREVDRLLNRAADRFGDTTAEAADPNEVAQFFETYAPDQEMQPAFENLFGGLLRGIKNVAGKAINLAKKGVLAVGSFALKALFGQLNTIIKPLLEQVLRRAIDGLPAPLKPVATQLAQRFASLRPQATSMRLRAGRMTFSVNSMSAAAGFCLRRVPSRESWRRRSLPPNLHRRGGFRSTGSTRRGRGWPTD
jgi:hypothetical protein